jgi:1,2-diacylglycerol 3-beta-glucosyltransferase
MTSRLLAASLLVASALIAWLAITFALAARALQAAIGLSMVYVGFLAWRGWQTMRRGLALAEVAESPVGERPWISVVVPARDEASVIGRVIEDLGRQTYRDAAGPRFDVVVIDDGSYDTTGQVARTAAKPFGDLVRVIRRERGGPSTKGTALRDAHAAARGEVVVALDADARLAPDFLDRTMRAWRDDPTAAAIQVQRRAADPRGWLSAAQDEEQLMDMASQCGRWATDGTAELRGNGMFVRREALERVGGWSARVLTEDLDLATRLVAAGEHVALAPAVEVREEEVERPLDLWHQRMRWAEGSLRRLMELGPSLVTNHRLPIGRRVDFVLFVGEFLIPPLFVTAIVASLLTIPMPQPVDITVPVSLFIGYGLGTFMLALAGLAAHGVRGWALVGRSTRGSLFLSHWLIVVPAALLRIAIGPAGSTFVRTPRAGTDR